MKPTKETPSTKAFYLNLAALYYAMGMIDKKFVVEEKKQVIQLIRQNWQPARPNLNVEEIMFGQLKKLVDWQVKAEVAYASFVAYFTDKPEVFTDAIRKQILDDIYLIAASYAKRNKSELVFFSRIVHLFFPSK